MKDSEAVVRILQTVGLRDLMGSDGCWCGTVQLRGFTIDRSCHKSESSLRVYSVGEIWPEALAVVATEALKQMRDEDDWADILVRYCDYAHDHWIGRDPMIRERGHACVYCGKAREDAASYLCQKCLHGEKAPGYPIAEMYDYASLTPHGLQLANPTEEVEE